MQALAGQQDMVRWLVSEGGLAVDALADSDSTGLTPLMAVCLFRCCWDDATGFRWQLSTALQGKYQHMWHTCGFANSPQWPPSCRSPACTSLLPMAQTLIELGANLGAVNAEGCDVLAVVALRGSYSLWGDLVKHVPDLLQRCGAVHAGQVLQSAAQWCAHHGDLEQLRAVLRFLQRGFALAGRGSDWLAQINEPVSRHFFVDPQQLTACHEQALSALSSMPAMTSGQAQPPSDGGAEVVSVTGAGTAPEQATVHALRTLLLAARDKRAEVREIMLRGIELLLEAGVALDALRPSGPEDEGSCCCSLEVLEVLAAHVLREGRACQDGVALIVLLTLSIVPKDVLGMEDASSGELMIARQGRLATLLAQLAKRGADFRCLSISLILPHCHRPLIMSNARIFAGSLSCGR